MNELLGVPHTTVDRHPELPVGAMVTARMVRERYNLAVDDREPTFRHVEPATEDAVGFEQLTDTQQILDTILNVGRALPPAVDVIAQPRALTGKKFSTKATYQTAPTLQDAHSLNAHTVWAPFAVNERPDFEDVPYSTRRLVPAVMVGYCEGIDAQRNAHALFVTQRRRAEFMADVSPTEVTKAASQEMRPEAFVVTFEANPFVSLKRLRDERRRRTPQSEQEKNELHNRFKAAQSAAAQGKTSRAGKVILRQRVSLGIHQGTPVHIRGIEPVDPVKGLAIERLTGCNLGPVREIIEDFQPAELARQSLESILALQPKPLPRR
jgi:hypothetical protein